MRICSISGCLGCKCLGVDGARAACHHLGEEQAAHIAASSSARRRSPSVKMPIGSPSGPTMAVGAQPPAVITQGLGHGGIGVDSGHRVGTAHDVADAGEKAASERSTWMRARKIVGGKAARVEQRHRERVAECERGGGAGGGREIERAGFFC